MGPCEKQTNRQLGPLSREKLVNTGGNANRKSVLITGVPGFVGSHLADTFVRSGYAVTGMLRETSSRKFIEHLDIDLRFGDLGKPETLGSVVEGHDYIVHPAGLIMAKSADEFMRANRDGTRFLREAARERCPGLKRFVYISSQAAAGPSDSTSGNDETVPPHPVSDYGRSKLAGEIECLKLKDQFAVTIVRPPAVYGPRDDGVLAFFKIVKSGWYWKLGRKERYASIVFVKDLAKMILAAVESDVASGEVFFAANPGPLSIWDIQKMIASVMKVEVKPLLTPIWLVRAMVPLDAFGSMLTGKARGLTADKIRELLHQYWICDSSKAERLLGWKAETPLEDGIAETIEWYERNRWL